MKKGPFEVLESKVIYENPWIKVYEDKVKRPDGNEGIFGIVKYSPGVHILALDESGQAILIREYMYAIEREDIMFPAGGVDEGETPLEAAKRELLEEVGYESDNWVELGMVNPLTMVIKAPYYLFLAQNCKKVKKGENTIEILKFSLAEVENLIRESKITQSGTICDYFKAKMHLEKLSHP
jgi:8-oxo-dGTP pyrophosphatase MutT (NUDIX family)